MLTIKEKLHNWKMDLEVSESEREQEMYELNLKMQKEQFEKQNPLFPKDVLATMFMCMRDRKRLVQIRYVD